MYTGNPQDRGDPNAYETALGEQGLTRLFSRIQKDATGRSWGPQLNGAAFLDEAIALAAAQLRCFFCGVTPRRHFVARGRLLGWQSSPRAADVDAVLHAERLDHGRKRLTCVAGWS